MSSAAMSDATTKIRAKVADLLKNTYIDTPDNLDESSLIKCFEMSVSSMCTGLGTPSYTPDLLLHGLIRFASFASSITDNSVTVHHAERLYEALQEASVHRRESPQLVALIDAAQEVVETWTSATTSSLTTEERVISLVAARARGDVLFPSESFSLAALLYNEQALNDIEDKSVENNANSRLQSLFVTSLKLSEMQAALVTELGHMDSSVKILDPQWDPIWKLVGSRVWGCHDGPTALWRSLVSFLSSDLNCAKGCLALMMFSMYYIDVTRTSVNTNNKTVKIKKEKQEADAQTRIEAWAAKQNEIAVPPLVFKH